MERLERKKSTGLTGSRLRIWGLLFLAAGILGQSVIQNRLLGTDQRTPQQLLELMSGSESAMILATAALVLKAIQTCALPIFAFLLTEGFSHTKSRRNYFFRVVGAALVSEIPYNLAMGGKLLDLSSRNPVFGLALSIAVLYFLQYYGQKSFQNVVIRVLVLLAALLWTAMLRISYGGAIVLLSALLWLLRSKPQMRIIAGSVCVVAFTIMDPFYLAAPMGFLPVHLYNTEPGEQNRLAHYLAYPVILLVIGLAAKFI